MHAHSPLTFTFDSAAAKTSPSCGGLTPQGERPTGSERDQEIFEIYCKVDGQPVEVTCCRLLEPVKVFEQDVMNSLELSD